MLPRITLRYRIYLLLSGLVFITLAGGLLMVWYTYQMETLLEAITGRHLVSYQTAQALETALVNQKGFVSYYFLDGDPDWLKQLGTYRLIFSEKLAEAQRLALEAKEKRPGYRPVQSRQPVYRRGPSPFRPEPFLRDFKSL